MLNTSNLLTTMWVALGASHHYASRTEHKWGDSTGSYDFESFYKLEIKQKPGEGWCHLFRYTADNRVHGKIAETFCETVEGAICEAEWEFGVRPDEWQIVDQQSYANDSNDNEYKT